MLILWVFFTEQLVGEHVQLLLVQASVGDGGELPAENLGQLRPLCLRGVEEELQVLRTRREKTRTSINIKNMLVEEGVNHEGLVILSLGSVRGRRAHLNTPPRLSCCREWVLEEDFFRGLSRAVCC